ncbi:MAG: helix-turn-helix domain-containing protein [Acidaminococcaceae bacterium]|nr:helix-turn-helix domain-containing protein [Acidaminococcaceae bacterium]
MGRPSKEDKIKQVPRRLLYTPNEAAILLCCGRPFLLDEINKGKLGFVQRGQRRFVPAVALEKYVEEHTQIGGKAL